MKRTTTRMLSIMLIAATVPVRAQSAPTSRLDLARAITREVERFADTNPFPSPAPIVQAVASDRSDWSRVRKLRPGTRVVVTVGQVKYPARRVVEVDEGAITVERITPQTRLLERLARDEVSEIRAYAGQAGTFWGDFGALVPIGGALVGMIGGGMLAHRQFAHHKALGATLGAAGGYVVGVTAGFGIMKIGGGFRENVVYRAP